MITHDKIHNFDKNIPTVITIGTFDGVHLGHRKIIDRLVATARSNGMESAVLTFFPHPRMVLQQDSQLRLLNTIEERKRILDETGLDHLIIHPFTRDFSRLTAVEFIRDVLVNHLNTRKIIIGYDHRFGRNRTANIKDLVEYGAVYNFTVEEISAQEINDVSISSTKIRTALENGDVTTANLYLGYEYMLNGIVVKGRGLGRQLEFPTANLTIEESYKLIPKTGSYVIRSVIADKPVFGMMNIGYNPTVDGSKKTIEIHFFDFENDLYGQKLTVQLLSRLRDEQKFESLEALKQQLFADKDQAMRIVQNEYAE